LRAERSDRLPAGTSGVVSASAFGGVSFALMLLLMFLASLINSVVDL